MATVGDVAEGGGEDAHLVTVMLADGRDGQDALTLVDLLAQDIEHDMSLKVFSASFHNCEHSMY